MLILFVVIVVEKRSSLFCRSVNLSRALTVGVALLNVQKDYSILTGTLYGLATAIGYWIAIVILAFLREKMADNEIPRPFRGFPITLIAASIMSMAFVAFGGLLG